jgi:hypothetical protein
LRRVISARIGVRFYIRFAAQDSGTSPLNHSTRSRAGWCSRALCRSGAVGSRSVACRMSLEVFVSKRQDRPYQAGRSKHWIKVKNRNHPAMERVIETFR